MRAKDARVMVITPHPDDAEFGAAGTVAEWVEAGKEIVYVVCTSGEKGAVDPDVSPKELAKTREREQSAAAALLGVREVIFLRYEDQALEDTPSFRKEIVRWIRTFRPVTVITTDPYRRYIWHRDHRITGQVVLDAVFPYARDHLAYPDLLVEGLEPHKVREVLLWGTDDPNYFTDITRSIDLKLAALRCHESQVGGDLFPAVEEWVKQRALAAARGQQFELGEAFHREEIRW